MRKKTKELSAAKIEKLQKAVQFVEVDALERLIQFSLRVQNDLLLFLQDYHRKKKDSSKAPNKNMLIESWYGANKKEWREHVKCYKDCWVTLKINPQHPEDVAFSINRLLTLYRNALHVLDLRIPKEEKRGKLPFPKKPSNYPSKIIQRCHTKIKRQVGRYLRDHKKLRITIGNILADEFDKLRTAIKQMRLNEKCSLFDDALDRKARDGHYRISDFSCEDGADSDDHDFLIPDKPSWEH